MAKISKAEIERLIKALKEILKQPLNKEDERIYSIQLDYYEGKLAQLAGRKNPYPRDNIVPEDFNIKNVDNWDFKLNTKATLMDYYGEYDLRVKGGWLWIRHPGDEKAWVEVIQVWELILAYPETKTLRLTAQHAALRDLVTHIDNARPITREIIEKGMAQEGYKMKKNPPGAVVTKNDEGLWKKAKKIVQRQYARGRPFEKFTEENWRQVMGIYRNMLDAGAVVHKNPTMEADTTTDIDIGKFHEELFKEARNEVEKETGSPFTRFNDSDWNQVISLFRKKKDYRQNPTKAARWPQED